MLQVQFKFPVHPFQFPLFLKGNHYHVSGVSPSFHVYVCCVYVRIYV